jgi:hypothetical protein
VLLLAELAATFCSGIFFGAALYISLVQHPAAIDTGLAFARAFHAPMYRRAAVLQASLALIAAAASAVLYFYGIGTIWLIAALLIVSVVPLTVAVIRPVNEVLMGDASLSEAELRTQLQRWGQLHWLRTLASGASFIACLHGLTRLS